MRVKRKARQNHVTIADRTFDTKALQNAIDIRIAEIDRDARVRLTDPADELTTAQNRAQITLGEALRKLTVLTYHYKPDIDA